MRIVSIDSPGITNGYTRIGACGSPWMSIGIHGYSQALDTPRMTSIPVRGHQSVFYCVALFFVASRLAGFLGFSLPLDHLTEEYA